MTGLKKITFNAINETIIFSKSTAQTNGEYLEIIVNLPSKGIGPIFLKHPLQTKYFECIEGELIVDLAIQKYVLKPGDNFTVPKNIAHTCYPSSHSGSRFKIIYTPALNFEYIVTELFASSNRNFSKHANIFDAC